MKISLKQLRSIIKESLLKEEESDYYRDYRAGTISRREYEELVDRFQSGGSKGSRDKMRSSDYAVRTIPAGEKFQTARKKIGDAMHDAGLTSALHDYSEMRDYLESGYKEHPEYDGKEWDLAASSKLKSLERQLG